MSRWDSSGVTVVIRTPDAWDRALEEWESMRTRYPQLGEHTYAERMDERRRMAMDGCLEPSREQVAQSLDRRKMLAFCEARAPEIEAKERELREALRRADEVRAKRERERSEADEKLAAERRARFVESKIEHRPSAAGPRPSSSTRAAPTPMLP